MYIVNHIDDFNELFIRNCACISEYQNDIPPNLAIILNLVLRAIVTKYLKVYKGKHGDIQVRCFLEKDLLDSIHKEILNNQVLVVVV